MYSSFGTSGIKIGEAEGGGLSMMTAADGEAVIIGKAPSGTSPGIILQEFNTLATSQTYYVEYDADYNVTSLSNSSGGVVERYAYDPYGNVTVESATGSTLGNGSAAGSLYGWVYLHQGLRLDVLTGLDDDRMRQTYDPALGSFEQQDPSVYVDGPDEYEAEKDNEVNHVDQSGEDSHGLPAGPRPTTGPSVPTDPTAIGANQLVEFQKLAQQFQNSDKSWSLNNPFKDQGTGNECEGQFKGDANL